MLKEPAPSQPPLGQHERELEEKQGGGAPEEVPHGGEFEFLQGDVEHRVGDTQTLAGATEEQMAELDAALLNQEEKGEGGDDDEGMGRGWGDYVCACCVCCRCTTHMHVVMYAPHM